MRDRPEGSVAAALAGVVELGRDRVDERASPAARARKDTVIRRWAGIFAPLGTLRFAKGYSRGRGEWLHQARVATGRDSVTNDEFSTLGRS
jgi:hypothetical protein